MDINAGSRPGRGGAVRRVRRSERHGSREGRDRRGVAGAWPGRQGTAPQFQGSSEAGQPSALGSAPGGAGAR